MCKILLKQLLKGVILINLKYLESIKHGSADYPIALYRVNKDFPRYRMMCHWHMEHELIRIISGHLELRINETEYTLYPGDSIMIRGSALHSGEPFECEYECAVFSTSVLTQLAGCREQLMPILGSNTDISRVYKKGSDISGAVDGFFSALSEDQPGYRLAAMAELYIIFSLIIKNKLYFEQQQKNAVTGRYLVRLKETLEWLEKNYRKNITLNELADIAGFSPKYFCRLFSKLTGRSPIDYLNCYRIDRASEMLLNSDTPVIDIAAECGFYDVSYFVKVFRKYKSVPPGQYRKNRGNSI